MKLEIDRKYKKDKYTIGNLYIDGKWFCNTLEDTDRGLRQDMTTKEILAIKIPAQTAIPTGKYEVLVTYSPKYKKAMPLVNNVKGYAGIRIHSGNTDKDTEGCILVGENKEKGKVLNSRVTFNKLFQIIQKAYDKKEKITLEIK